MTIAPADFDPFVNDYVSLACLAAVMRNDAPQAIACLLAGADPNLADPDRHRTVLHWAAHRGLVEVIRVALRSGADEQAVDSDGYTYADLLYADDVPKVDRLTTH